MGRWDLWNRWGGGEVSNLRCAKKQCLEFEVVTKKKGNPHLSLATLVTFIPYIFFHYVWKLWYFFQFLEYTYSFFIVILSKIFFGTFSIRSNRGVDIVNWGKGLVKGDHLLLVKILRKIFFSPVWLFTIFFVMYYLMTIRNGMFMFCL